MPKNLNLNFKKYLTSDTVCLPKLYWKIFSLNHLENFNNFIESILIQESNTMKNKNSSESLTKFSLKIEQKLFKFLFQEKILQKKFNKNSTSKNTLPNYASIIRKKMVINSSKFIEICYKHKFFSNNFTTMNQIIFYYLINFYDVSNRKFYPYFNIYIILYYIMNKNYDDSFKRFVISRLLVNMDLLKYSHFIILLDEIFKNSEKLNLINLFHPFNPMKVDQDFLENFFDKKSKKNSSISNETAQLFTAHDLILTVNLSEKFPIKQKIILIENLIQKLNENCLKTLTTIELLNFIKCLKKVELKYFDFDFFQFKNSFTDSKNLLQNLKMKSELKLKYSFNKTHIEYYYSNIPFFLNLIREISVCGKYIEDKEIFEDFFNLIRKSAMINFDLNSVINSLFEIFIELHPNFIFKLFIQDWSEKIFRDENVGRITKNVLKCVLYFSLKFERTNEDVEIEKIQILKDFVKNLYFDKNDFRKRFDSVDDLIEICFYMILVKEMNLIEFDDEKVFEQFLKSQIELISKFLLGDRKISFDEEFIKEILSNAESKNNSRVFNFSLLKNKKDSLNFLFLVCKYIQGRDSNFLSDDINFAKIRNLCEEITNYVIKEFCETSCFNSFLERKINQELKVIVNYLNKNISKSDKIKLEEDFFFFSELFEYTHRYSAINFSNSKNMNNFLFITFQFDYGNILKRELKETFIERFLQLLFSKNKSNSKTLSVDVRKWVTLKKEEKINLIRSSL